MHASQRARRADAQRSERRSASIDGELHAAKREFAMRATPVTVANLQLELEKLAHRVVAEAVRSDAI